MGEDWIINPTQEQIKSVLSPSLDEMKKQAILKTKRDADIYMASGFYYNGDIYQSEDKDINRLHGLYSIAVV